ncbi:MAG TPA: DNA gyrase inhibitor YacG [Candidatus Binatia bacterium]|nr:DNA gyrase inhibitor YacG [Candidatus Binatia bacterium]
MKCPICANPTSAGKSPEFPFCSERCRLLDLGNWASGRYVVSEPALEDLASLETLDERTRHNGGNGPGEE